MECVVQFVRQTSTVRLKCSVLLLSSQIIMPLMEGIYLSTAAWSMPLSLLQPSKLTLALMKGGCSQSLQTMLRKISVAQSCMASSASLARPTLHSQICMQPCVSVFSLSNPSDVISLLQTPHFCVQCKSCWSGAAGRRFTTL